MDAAELLKSWPTWAKAGAEKILSSPAWRVDVRLGEERGIMTAVTDETARPGDDVLSLEVAFDGEPAVLALADSPLYPDLHLLWTKRADLPPEIVLALAERECGNVFAMLENLARRQFSVKGLADASVPRPSKAYAVTVPGGSLSFALDFDPETLQRFARLDNLDPTHDSIRALTRPAYPDYTALLLTEDERAALAAGDFILLPEGFPSTQTWAVEPPAEGALHLVSSDLTDIPFAAFADETLPPVPEPANLVLVSGDRRLFACELARIGDARAFRLQPLT